MKNIGFPVLVSAVVVALILIVFLFPGTGERSVSNFYLIPAGTYSPLHNTNQTAGPAGVDVFSSMYPAGSDMPDAWFEISEYQPDALKNRTLIHLSDEDLDELPGLEKIFLSANSNTRAWSVIGQRYTGGFDGNMTRFYHFNKVICDNSPLDICFAQPPLFEYHGRNFTLSADEYHSHTTAPPTLPVHTPAPVEKKVSIVSVSRLPR